MRVDQQEGGQCGLLTRARGVTGGGCMSVDRMIREKWIESREARRELQSERGGATS